MVLFGVQSVVRYFFVSPFCLSPYSVVWLHDMWHMLLQSINQVCECEHDFLCLSSSFLVELVSKKKEINLVEWIEHLKSLFRMLWPGLKKCSQTQTLLTVNINCLQSITFGGLFWMCVSSFLSRHNLSRLFFFTWNVFFFFCLSSLKIVLFIFPPNKWWHKLNPIYEPKPIYDIKRISSWDRKDNRKIARWMTTTTTK